MAEVVAGVTGAKREFSIKERKRLIAMIPWITYSTKRVPCDGIRWSQVPLKAIYTMGGKPPTGTEKYRCKNWGYWHFTAHKKSGATTGVYCWHHLGTQIHHDPIEEDRYINYVQRNYDRMVGELDAVQE